MIDMNIYEIFKSINVFGPSGQEDQIREKIKSIVQKYSDDISVDGLGNLIVHIKGSGKGKKILYAAHMDSLGLMVTDIDEKGFVHYTRIGCMGVYAAYSQCMVFENGTRASLHMSGSADWSSVREEQLYLDLGVKDKASAEKLVQFGDMCVYDAPTWMTNDNFIVSPYLDNRICCTALIFAMERLYEMKPENDIYFAFTVQEEIGMKGAGPAAYGVKPDYAIVCDVTHSNDIPGGTDGTSSVGKGAAIKVKDTSVLCNPKLVKAIRDTAEKNGIRYQFDVFGGNTDGGYMSVTGTGIPTSGISIPIRYCHRPQEYALIDDVEDVIELITAFSMSSF